MNLPPLPKEHVNSLIDANTEFGITPNDKAAEAKRCPIAQIGRNSPAFQKPTGRLQLEEFANQLTGGTFYLPGEPPDLR